SAMLLDGLPGGSGARWGGDGPDTGGYLTSPAGLCTNIETNERHYPVLYRHRRERPDSGGPGRWRGGVGVEHAYQLHQAAGTVTSTVFAHGQQPPTAAGVVGGEPGMQHTGVYERSDGTIEVPPPKQVGELALGDVYANLCGGGGGVGDPLDRDPIAVEHDVAEGLVTEAGAARDYGVVIGDETATEELQASRRHTRIGKDPAPPLDQTPAGRRLSSTVALADGHYLCRRCGHDHGPTNEPLVSQLTVARFPVNERTSWPSARPGDDRFEICRLYCPACAVQVDVQVALADAPLLETAELLDN
ncbi:MAG: hydantoinase B/oxoprolinase family protein, partial [bacterium]|nr:hydantoinase B/oxoprolinase family protein [bacterium]